ncbi:hypothetical protein [Microbacterium aurantiacum]|uniref:hypothetical protein n=1 Tax=Microbacterium aurantiacum TaxID=162393 RepID=UPI0011AEE075|nr:hypothetical protein [Microbacterium aurantiacum]
MAEGADAGMSADGSAGRPTQRSLLDAATVELRAFGQIGRQELAESAWHESREAAEQAWRECRAGMRKQYGARNPTWGWSSFALLTAALCAAVAAAMNSGVRSDPAQTAVAVTVLVAIAGLLDLAVVVAIRARPVNAGFIRPQLVVAIGLGAAAAFHLSRGITSTTMLFVIAAVIGVGGLVLFLLVRALRPAERDDMDTVINVAVARKQPEVDAIAVRLQAQVLAELSAEEQDRIVALRTEWLPSSPRSLPAGGMIISALLSDWVPFRKYL